MRVLGSVGHGLVHAGAWALLALPAGCGGDAPAKHATDPAHAYEEVFTGGPVSMVLRLDRTAIALGEHLTLTQELRTERGFAAEFPEYLPEDFEHFAVTDIRQSPPPAAPAQSGAAQSGAAHPEVTVLTKHFTLEPDRSGPLTIAPFEVFFHPVDDAKRESSFRTEEITVTVAPIEDVGALHVLPPRGIFETSPVEKPSRAAWWFAGGAGVLLAAAAAAFAVLRRRRPALAPPPVPPHEIAWEALRRLIALDLIAKGQIERFYVHLSSIMRQYIEDRFRVRAPELTTEEFIVAAAASGELGPHRPRLKEFLNLSDMVKFARFEPDTHTIQESFDVVKRFIEETVSHAA